LHELSIATAILDSLEAELEKRPGARFTRVGVRVGELSGVDPDALEFGFGALVKETHWEPLALEIERVPRLQRCPKCGHEWQVERFATDCPQCGELGTVTVSGEELQIVFIEVEEP